MLPLSLALGACQPGWVRLDGSRAETDALRQAREFCEVDARLAELDRARAANSVEATKAPSNEARMMQLDSFETENYRVYQQIDACMRDRGLRRAQ
jgi:hypothetical protein